LICPHCHQKFALPEALSDQISEKLEKELLDKVRTQVKRETEVELKDKINETEELAKYNKDLQSQVLDLTKLIRELKKSGEERELEMQKRLSGEEEKIKEESRKKAEEEYRLKMLEAEKKLREAITANDELRRKLEQGSQQTQGEVQEILLEDLLKAEFPQDTISEVATGVRGGDLVQTVFDKKGQQCGKIIWESKQTKAWSEGWVSKLKEDQRAIGADIAVLISAVLPPKIKSLGYYQGIWVTSLGSALGACWILRYHLVQATSIKQTASATGEKKDELYDYVTSVQFQHRVEAMMDSYQEMLLDAEKEKRWFSAKWAKQEKSLRTLMEQTSSIHGELAGIVGSALPGVKNLELTT